jgi:hypothetical protein
VGLVMACVLGGEILHRLDMQSQASRHKLEPIGSVAFEPQQRRGSRAWQRCQIEIQFKMPHYLLV